MRDDGGMTTPAPATAGTAPRTALVTGAGRGIGRGLALGLVRAGWDVALAGRTRAHLDAVAEEARAARPGARVLVEAVDVVDRAAVAAAVARVEQAFADLGGLGLLVNNAGVIERAEVDLVADDVEDVWRVIETNVRGPLLLAHAVLPGMLARGSGHVVNINSGSGHRPSGVYTGYGISKGALARCTTTAPSGRRSRRRWSSWTRSARGGWTPCTGGSCARARTPRRAWRRWRTGSWRPTPGRCGWPPTARTTRSPDAADPGPLTTPGVETSGAFCPTRRRVSGRTLHSRGLASEGRGVQASRDVRALARRPQGVPQALGSRVELLGREVVPGVREAQLGLAPRGQHVQVQVRHLEPGDQQRGARRVPRGLLRPADRLRDHGQVRQQVVVGLGERRHLGARHDQHVAVRDRGDGAERHGAVVGPDEPAGDVAVDDAREQGGHAAHGSEAGRAPRRRAAPAGTAPPGPRRQAASFSCSASTVRQFRAVPVRPDIRSSTPAVTFERPMPSG